VSLTRESIHVQLTVSVWDERICYQNKMDNKIKELANSTATILNIIKLLRMANHASGRKGKLSDRIICLTVTCLVSWHAQKIKPKIKKHYQVNVIPL